MRNEAIRENVVETALRMFAKGYDIEAIADAVDISVDEVKEIVNGKSA